MPIYEYRCTRCNHTLEIIQKMSDAPLIECPECHRKSLRKLVSATSFRLKGAGWYETDFKKSGTRKHLVDSGEKSGSGTESGTAGNEGSNKSKPAAAPAKATEKTGTSTVSDKKA